MTARQSTTSRLTDLLDGKFLARLDALDVHSRRILRGHLRGERQSKRRGDGVEFADHRPYVAGDDLRFIDWNIYGRLDELFSKVFLEEQDLTFHVMVDVSGSVAWGEPSKERFSKQLAAALTYVGVTHNNRVTLSAFANGVVAQLPNIRGRAYLPQVAEMLTTTSPGGDSDFEKSCRQVVSNRRGAGVMVVLSDFFFKGGYEQGLRRLLGRQYDLYGIQVLAPQELSPPLTGDLRLVDIEDGDIAEVTISSALMKFYKRNLAAYCSELKTFLTAHGATHVLTNSGEQVESLVLNYLRRIDMLR